MSLPVDECPGTALVTGGAKRLGRAISLGLARQGLQVVIHYNDSERDAEETAREIDALGGTAWTLQADLADPEAVSLLFERAVDAAGPISCLVNNASIFPEGGLAELSLGALQDNMGINAYAPFVLGRSMAAQGGRGVIINMLDTRITDYDRNHVAYHLSKRTLFDLTRMMAVEFAPAMRVNAVAPGLILPPEGKDRAYLESLASTNPLNRYGGPDDVVEAVVFLLRAGFVTGQVIFVDGGRHMRGNMYGC